MTFLRRGAAVLLTTLLLTACGSNGSDDSSDKADQDEKSEADTTKTFVVDTKDLQFELPSDYDEIDTGELGGADLEEQMKKEFADNLGEEGAAQMAQMASQAELFAFDDEAVDGFLANVNVIVVGAVDKLPTAGQVELEFRSIGGDVTSTDEVETALGDALLVEYDLAMQGATIQGAGLLLIVDDDLVNITTSTLDAEESRKIADLIVDSLESAD